MASGIRPRSRTTIYYGEGSDSGEGSRSTRIRKRPNYVVDISSDDEGFDSVGPDADITEPPLRQQLPRRVSNRSAKRKVQPGTSKPYQSSKRQKILGAPPKQKHRPRNEDQAARPGGKITPWQILEHDILTNILEKAAYPLYQGYLRPNASIRWLVGMSYLSKSFHAAAISALLSCPPLINGSGLLNLLKLDQDVLSTNFRMKPRKLVVEAKNSLVQKASKISLPELVSVTPLLESLRIVSSYDEISLIWAHPSVAKRTYIYEDSLFEALESFCPRLKEFEWNGRFAAGLPELIRTATSAHMRLRGLTSITLMNLNVLEKTSVADQDSLREQLLSALNKLPELKHLNITNCDVFGNFAGLASLQTSQLKSLTISDCPSLTSTGLEIFLSTKGVYLEHLSLHGCQTCDGAFLSRLAQLCGRLKVLQIDLTFSDVTSFHDIDPHFDDFLPDGPISFPSTLIELEINNLRRVDSSQLELCLTSLVDSELPLLRRLSIKAILTSDYRIRARIRKNWGDKLEQVFLRHSTPPISNSQTRSKLPVYGREIANKPSATSTSDVSKKRQSSRMSRSLRPAAPRTVSEDFRSNDAPVERQGLCELVEFRVDDQRPAESQYAEADFLDDEMSGDEDYND